MSTAVYPLETPVPLSHPNLGEFCTQLRSQQEPFQVPLCERTMPIENCYWNVLAHVQQYGGAILFGWMLKHWPGLYLSAEHHAVWRRNDGEILDVTERRPDCELPTTFVLDSNQHIDVSGAPNIPVEFFRLTGDRRVLELIDLSARSNSAAASVNRFLVTELRQSSDEQLAVARGETVNRIQITSEQRREYECLLRKCSEIRLQIGDVIHSLVSRPPNRLSRIATKAYANQR